MIVTRPSNTASKIKKMNLVELQKKMIAVARANVPGDQLGIAKLVVGGAVRKAADKNLLRARETSEEGRIQTAAQ